MINRKSNEEAQEPTLPKGRFRNRVTWTCYEIYKNLMCWMFSGFSVIGGLGMLKTGISCMESDWHRRVVFFTSAAVGCPGSIFASTLAWMNFVKKGSKYSSKVAQQVLELNPGSDIEKWDLISSRLNDDFCCSKDWKTPYFFFNGEDAQDLFTVNVVKSYLHGKLDATISANEITSAKAYVQSLSEEFESELKETLWELSPESELRKESKGKGFSENLKDIIFYLFRGLGILSIDLSLIMWLMFYVMFTSKYSFIFCLYMTLLNLGGIIVLFVKNRSMRARHALKFLAVVTKIKPENTLDKWHRIARYMNEYLYDEQAGLNFSGGKDCLEFYKREFQLRSSGNEDSNREPRYYELKDILKTIQLNVA